jgi:hypothetical protein
MLTLSPYSTSLIASSDNEDGVYLSDFSTVEMDITFKESLLDFVGDITDDVTKDNILKAMNAIMDNYNKKGEKVIFHNKEVKSFDVEYEFTQNNLVHVKMLDTEGNVIL